MEDILNSINEAEQKAAEIKSNAEGEAARILINAEGEAAEILKKSETECRLYAEHTLRKGREEAQKNYDAEIQKATLAAEKYAEEKLKSAQDMANKIVRRILSGS